MTTSLWSRKKLAQIKNTAHKVRSSGGGGNETKSKAATQSNQRQEEEVDEASSKLPQPGSHKLLQPAAAAGPATGSSIIVGPASEPKSVLGLEYSYSSPLEHLRGEEAGAVRLDPHTQLCRFQLDGECRDSQCEYQHLRPQ